MESIVTAKLQSWLHLNYVYIIYYYLGERAISIPVIFVWHHWFLGSNMNEKNTKTHFRLYLWILTSITYCLMSSGITLTSFNILHFIDLVIKSIMGYSREKNKQGSWGHGISRGQLKKKQNFQGKNSVRTHVEFPWVLVFELGISKGCHTILLNFQESKLVFSGIS